MSKEFKRTEHSDIIIHWTGRDIDAKDPEMQKTLPVNWRKHCLRPIEKPSKIKDPNIIENYVDRLRDILKFGLWMTNDKPVKGIESCSNDDGRVSETPSIARVCFTELKLSESRRHAFEYGRLGIGLKRMFLLNRAGLPMLYISKNKLNWFSNFNDAEKPNVISNAQKSYFKHMSETEDLNYKYYSETEWRIVCSNNTNSGNAKLDNIKKEYFIDVNGTLQDAVVTYSKRNRVQIEQKKLKEFIDKNRDKGLKFLVPLDFWLAIIIYPCPAVKIIAEQDDEIRKLILKTRIGNLEEEYHNLMKLNDSIKKKKIEKLTKTLGETYMLPMEIDLDAISQF